MKDQIILNVKESIKYEGVKIFSSQEIPVSYLPTVFCLFLATVWYFTFWTWRRFDILKIALAEN